VFIAEHSKFEGRFAAVAKDVLKAQEKYVLEKVSAGVSKQLAQTAGWSKRRLAVWVKSADATVRYNLEKRAARKAVSAAFEPVMKECVQHFGERRGDDVAGLRGKTDLGVAFNMNDKRVQKWLGDRLEELGKSLVDTTFDDVKTILRGAFEEGVPEAEIAERLRTKFDTYDKYRAQLIARTEVTASANFADVEAVKQAGLEGVLKKVWIDSGDEATRPEHHQAGIRYAKGIALDDDFEVGGDTMQAPGMGSDAGQNINCRCSIGYIEA
jgi:SPP1 gp7 family putative phage head morphogenesis protein